MKLTIAVPVGLVLASPLLPACGTNSSHVAAFSQDSIAVTAEALFTDSYSGIDDARRLVIRDASRWQAVWAEVVGQRTPAPDPPSVDFDQDMVILAAMGRRGTGGYTIAIDRVYAEGGQLYAVVRETSPAPGCMTIQALTAPVTAVQVPQSDQAVSFIERKEMLDCS